MLLPKDLQKWTNGIKQSSQQIFISFLSVSDYFTRSKYISANIYLALDPRVKLEYFRAQWSSLEFSEGQKALEKEVIYQSSNVYYTYHSL